jgi:hypothetical protein
VVVFPQPPFWLASAMTLISNPFDLKSRKTTRSPDEFQGQTIYAERPTTSCRHLLATIFPSPIRPVNPN